MIISTKLLLILTLSFGEQHFTIVFFLIALKMLPPNPQIIQALYFLMDQFSPVIFLGFLVIMNIAAKLFSILIRIVLKFS